MIHTESALLNQENGNACTALTSIRGTDKTLMFPKQSDWESKLSPWAFHKPHHLLFHGWEDNPHYGSSLPLPSLLNSVKGRKLTIQLLPSLKQWALFKTVSWPVLLLLLRTKLLRTSGNAPLIMEFDLGMTIYKCTFDISRSKQQTVSTILTWN